MPYFTTTNTFRFSLVLFGFITLVACGSVNEETSPINEAPTASRVTITDDNAGNFVVGDSLTGNYVYADAENDTEGVSIYRWLRNGKFIDSTTISTYILVAADVGQSITFEVTPVAETGTAIGNAALSNSITIYSAPVADAGADQTAVFGDRVTLNGSASFDVDGDPLTYSWSFTSKPALSAAVLSNPAAVNPGFDIDVSGDYVVQLIVNDGTLSSVADTVTISTRNSAPVADAGTGQTPLVGETVALNGSTSSDVDGDPLTYRWSLTSKPASSATVLSNPTTVNPSFDIDLSGDYVVQLIVNDGTLNSAPDTVSISTTNSAPVADAGADQTPLVGETVALNGSASSDVDGDPLTYRWSLTTVPPDSMATLINSTTVNPSFDIDLSGNYVVQLIVNDGTLNSAADTVTISTTNSAPVADAGAGQTPRIGDTVTLNGSASSDVDGDPLTYRWSLTSKPASSVAVLSDPIVVNPRFDIDLSGDYVVQLIVNDGTLNSAADTVTISTTNSAPVADAGVDQAAVFGDRVNLNGSASSDVDGDQLTYRWSLTSKPASSVAVLSNPAAVNPSFDIDVSGDYVAQLIVNDGTLNSAADTVTISTTNGAPVADAGEDQAAFFGDTVFLNGSDSSDVDGDPLTYRWSLTTVPPDSKGTLINPTTVNPNFSIDVSGDYVAQLIVNDGTVDSVPGTVSISTANSAPVADAGEDQVAFFGDTVLLNGSDSSDVDGDPLTYRWSLTTKPPGSMATLINPTTVNPSFSIDVSGDYVAQLIVNDGTLNSAPDTVSIITANTAPVAVADAGAVQWLNGDTVILDGNGSSDVDGDDLTFSWSFTSRPAGSTAALINPTTVNPTFDIDVTGDYVVQLIVTDVNAADSAPDTVTINTSNSAPVLGAIGNQSINELATLSFTATATDADLPADTLTFSLDAASSAAGMTITSTGGVFSWTPTEGQGGSTPSVTITVTDGSLSDSKTFTITVNDVNTAPVLDTIVNKSIDELATLSFPATATDTDLPAATLAFSLDPASVAAGMTINANTGVFSWTPTEGQGGSTPSVTITVTDGSLSDSKTFTITVNDVNTAPVLDTIVNKSIDELATLSFPATATDTDLPAATLAFSLDPASVAAGMTINANTGVFSWTPTEGQGGSTPSVTITVTDGSLSDSKTFTITVNDVNTAPVLDTIVNKSIDELATLSFPATATDTDLPAATLAFSLDPASVAAGMTINANTGVFSWTPTEGQGGSTPSVTITVTDGSLSDSKTFTITVNDVNTAPVLDTIVNKSIDELATLSFPATATDTDLPAATLAFSLDPASVAAGMTINANTGVFSWTPTEGQGGSTPSVTITVTDGSLSDSKTFTITVNDVNTAPVLDTIVNKNIDELATLSFPATATDTDLPAATLAFSLDPASVAAGMTINANTGVFSWTPTEGQGGSTPSVTITVTDNGSVSLSDSKTFMITVNDVNTAPVLAAIGIQSINELATLSFIATATDADLPEDTLTFSLDAASLTAGMTIDASTGEFSWMPAEGQGGSTQSVTITVTDNGSVSLSDSKTFMITVNDVNTAPVLAAIGIQSINELATLSFIATATDADLPEDTLTFSLDAASVAAGMTIDASTGEFSWMPAEGQGGSTQSVTITVTDNGSVSLSDSKTFMITVNDVNTAPVLAAIDNKSINELATLSFTATATDADLPEDTLTFSLDAASLTAGMTIDASTGEFSWMPAEGQGGSTQSVTITVTDNGSVSLSDSKTFMITVNDVNTAPVLAAIDNKSINELATLSFTAVANDADLPADTFS